MHIGKLFFAGDWSISTVDGDQKANYVFFLLRIFVSFVMMVSYKCFDNTISLIYDISQYFVCVRTHNWF